MTARLLGVFSMALLVGCADGANPLGINDGADGGWMRFSLHSTGSAEIAIEPFSYPGPGGVEVLAPFDINDAGDIVAGRSLLRHTGDIVTFSQIIQTRAMAVNDVGQVLLRLWDSAGNGWSVTSTGSYADRSSGHNGLPFFPVAMNDLAGVVGIHRLSPAEQYAAYRDWSTDSLVDLHAQITGVLSLDYELAWSRARDINNDGQIVGSVWTRTPLRESAVLWKDGTAIDLGLLGGVESAAYAINESGVVVGERRFADGSYRAFRWRNGVMTDLGTLGGANSSASAINDHGQIAGHSTTADGAIHAFVWHDGVMYDLGVPGGATESFAHAINNAGQAVGSSFPAPPNTGTLWTFVLPDLASLPVQISTAPGAGQPPINRRSAGILSVIVFGSPEVDVRAIDLATVTLGDDDGDDTPLAQKPRGGYGAHQRDANRDGWLDLILDFDIRSLVLNNDLPAGNPTLVLDGLLLDGMAFRGSAEVRTLH